MWELFFADLDRQLLAAFDTARFEDKATCLAAHAGTKSVNAHLGTLFRLKRSFWHIYISLSIWRAITSKLLAYACRDLICCFIVCQTFPHFARVCPHINRGGS